MILYLLVLEGMRISNLYCSWGHAHETGNTSTLACEVMQDAEKLQLAVKQMQQILDKAHQIVHDPNLPNLLAAYDVTRDCILQIIQ